MKIINSVSRLKRKFSNPVLVIGVFDGVHHGHQVLIRKAVAKARAIKGTCIVMTFFPHPAHVVRPQMKMPLLISLPYRLKLIESLHVDACCVINFTKRFAGLSAGQFIKKYIVGAFSPKEIFIGDDFRFGHDRRGDLDFFKQQGRIHGFKVNVVTSVKRGNRAIGSSRLRELIAKGKLKSAAHLLGRNVSLMGRVVAGDTRGRTLGFPTANLRPRGQVIPPSGVYLVNVIVRQKRYQGLANIGRRPSFNKTSRRENIEVYIFDFTRTIYHQDIVVEFIKKLRDERTFPSREMLIRQIKKDEQKARRIFATSR